MNNCGKAGSNGPPFIRSIDVESLVNASKQTLAKNEDVEHYLQRLTHLTLNGTSKRVFQTIQNLENCPRLKVLYLYDNVIDKIENLQANTKLTHLYLQNNRIEKIENLEKLMYLEKIFLEKNRIERLEGLERCTRLQELHLSNQTTSHFSFCMESLKTLAMSLRVLNLSNCHIANIEPLLVLKCIEQMDLSKNNIDQVEQVYGLVGGLSTLKELDLTGNPVTQLPKYRENTIIFSTTRLVTLDKKDIDSNQRKMMQSHLAHKFKKRQEAVEARALVKVSNPEEVQEKEDKEASNGLGAGLSKATGRENNLNFSFHYEPKGRKSMTSHQLQLVNEAKSIKAATANASMGTMQEFGLGLASISTRTKAMTTSTKVLF